jgi:hypothetical protein
MSAAATFLAESSPTWLPPVSYDFDGFRRFSETLVTCLAELEQEFSSRHRTPTVRPASGATEGCDLVDQRGESQLPSA